MATVKGEVAVFEALNEGARTALLRKSEYLAERAQNLREKEFEHEKKLSQSISPDVMAQIALQRDKLRQDKAIADAGIQVEQERTKAYTAGIQVQTNQQKLQQVQMLTDALDDVTTVTDTIFQNSPTDPNAMLEAFKNATAQFNSISMAAEGILGTDMPGMMTYLRNAMEMRKQAWNLRMRGASTPPPPGGGKGLVDSLMDWMAQTYNDISKYGLFGRNIGKEETNPSPSKSSSSSQTSGGYEPAPANYFGAGVRAGKNDWRSPKIVNWDAMKENATFLRDTIAAFSIKAANEKARKRRLEKEKQANTK